MAPTISYMSNSAARIPQSMKTAWAPNGVRTQHPEYNYYSQIWERCRDVSAGSDAVKAKQVQYLPALEQQTASQYWGYLARANFYNAGERTISGLLGMIFRKPPVTNVPAGMTAAMQDIDMEGTPFDVFAEMVAREILTVNKVGVMVDYPPQPEDLKTPLTKSIAEQLGLRPSLKIYCAESIINWQKTKIGNVSVLSMVVLKEQKAVPATKPDGTIDEFAFNLEDRYRVLDLDDNGDYRIRIFKIVNENDVLEEEYYPVKDNKNMKEIQFVILNSEGVDTDTKRPVLLDLIDTNLSHYRSSADLEHGAHFCGVPTFYVAGYNPPLPEAGGLPDQIYLGAQTALVFQDPQARAGFAEFTGGGLTSIENLMDRKEQQMSILGARMLAPDGSIPEAGITAAIKRNGENSTLAAISISCSLGLSLALSMYANWEGLNTICTTVLNKDFLPVVIDGNILSAMFLSWQGGAIPDQVFFEWLQRGDIVDADINYVEFKGMTFQEPPAPGAGGAPPAKPTGPAQFRNGPPGAS